MGTGITCSTAEAAQRCTCRRAAPFGGTRPAPLTASVPAPDFKGGFDDCAICMWRLPIEGSKVLPVITSADGGDVQVGESSAASEPFIWPWAEAPKDRNHPEGSME